MGVSVLIAGKGGAGKTTVTAGLGMALAGLGHSVILLDASLGLRGLDLPLGLENQIVSHLGDVLAGRESLADVLLPVPGHENLSLLPAPQTKTAADLEPEEFSGLIEELKGRCDYVLMDAPGGIDWGFALAVEAAQRAVLVTDTSRSSVRAADRIAALLKGAGRRELHLFLNRIPPDLADRTGFMSMAEAQELLGLPTLGLLQESRRVSAFSQTGSALAGTAPEEAAALEQAARRLLGENIPLESPRPRSGFFRWLSGNG